VTIDDVLPAWDWRSAHAARVAASPERAAAAVREFSGRDLPVTGALMRVRALGRRTFDDRSTVEAMARIGLAVLVDEPYTVVVGGALSPWRLRGGHRPVASADELRAFAEPGWVRVAAAFSVTPEGDGSRVRTETRIAATDDAARRRFGRYWRVIGPFSSITRREMLAAIRRRAEA
jgi:sugar phosphate isomerase/epimerase